MRRTSKLTALLLTVAPLACSAPSGPPDEGPAHATGTVSEAVTAVGDWKGFTDGQCVHGLYTFYSSRFGISLPGACLPPGNVDNCEDCGACMIWKSAAVHPDPKLFDRYAWGTAMPQTYDIVVYPPKTTAVGYGHVAAVDHMESNDPGNWQALYVMDSNYVAPLQMAKQVHTVSRAPYGFYHLKSLGPLALTLDAQVVGHDSDAPKDDTGQADYAVCAGETFHFSIELRNTGSRAWEDLGTKGTEWGQRVKLGVPGDGTDVLTGLGRVSVSDDAASQVQPHGPDCNDAPTCRRTVFTKGSGMVAVAPKKAGVVTSQWQLVDEGRAWFGPKVDVAFRVHECASGGAGGAGGSSGHGGSSAGGVGAAGSKTHLAGAGGSSGTGGAPAVAGSSVTVSSVDGADETASSGGCSVDPGARRWGSMPLALAALGLLLRRRRR